MKSKTLSTFGVILVLTGIGLFFYTMSLEARSVMYAISGVTTLLGLLFMYLFGAALIAGYFLLVLGVILILLTLVSTQIVFSDEPIDYSYMILPLCIGAALTVIGYLTKKKIK